MTSVSEGFYTFVMKMTLYSLYDNENNAGYSMNLIEIVIC